MITEKNDRLYYTGSLNTSVSLSRDVKSASLLFIFSLRRFLIDTRELHHNKQAAWQISIVAITLVCLHILSDMKVRRAPTNLPVG